MVGEPMLNQFFTNLKLKRFFLILTLTSAILPTVLAGILILSNYLSEKKRLERENDQLNGKVVQAVTAIFKSLQAEAQMMSQNSDILELIMTKAELRRFVENRIFGNFESANERLGLPVRWSLFIGNAKTPTLGMEDAIAGGAPGLGFELLKGSDVLSFAQSIKLDDQNLGGPTAKSRGTLVGRLDLAVLRRMVPGLGLVLSVPNSLESEAVVISTENLSFQGPQPAQFLFGTGILIIIAVVFSLGLVQKLILTPLREMSEYLRASVPVLEVAGGENEIITLKKSIYKYVETLKQQDEERQIRARLEASSLLAKQVSHDIRSPLSALNMVLGTLGEIQEEKRILIRDSVRRINDIANNLLEKGKSGGAADSQPGGSVDLIPAVIDSIVSEKRTQFRHLSSIEIDANLTQSYGLFAWIDSANLKRALSNLINNSVEAIQSAQQGSGRVEIGVSSILVDGAESVLVSIGDNGMGIPLEIIERLGQEGVTFGKKGTDSGSGLGFAYSKQVIEEMGGKIRIESKLGQGTKVSLLLPRKRAPDWFVDSLVIEPGTKIISLDDDTSIHQLWKGRIEPLLGSAADFVGFTSGVAFKNWYAHHTNEKLCLLFDFELLNQAQSGLDIIEELDLRQAILVTSRYDEDQVRVRCRRLGIHIIPKGMAGCLPIKIEATRQTWDAVLVDDDSLVHLTWQMAASAAGKSLLCFFTVDEFLSACQKIGFGSQIFVDSNLGQNVRGEVASEHIFKLGFHNIILCTGYAPDQIQKPAWISRVIGKDPPFVG
jgi:signal transduction histidine kinase